MILRGIVPKMPVKGLPMMLEKLLDTLMKDTEIYSWNMKGADGYTHVNLKFKMADHGHQGMNLIYKRKPKSQTYRDHRRSDKWKDLQNVDKEYDSRAIDDNSDKESQSDIAIITKDIPVNQPAEDQGVSHDLASLPKTCDSSEQYPYKAPSESDLDIDQASMSSGQDDMEGNGETLEPTSNHVNNNNECGSAVKDNEDEGSGDKTVVIDEFTLELIDKYGELVKCDACHVPIPAIRGMGWMKCTICPDTKVCNSCWSNGRHNDKSHHLQMHSYTWQDRRSDIPLLSCNSCGFLYHEHNPNFRVWHCMQCRNYTICKRCHNDNMHQHHDQYLKERPLAIVRRDET